MIRILSKIAATAAVCLGAAAPAAADAPRLDWRGLPLPAIDGHPMDPDLLAGKVVLVVNTASQCGFTPQYKSLQALWQEYRDKGVVVLGVPSNDFGGQEPASNAEVARFCEVNYGVDFPLMAKQVVSGADAHPLYRWAAERTGPLGVPRWNFHKLLIGRDGRLLDWFASTTTPDSTKLRAALDKAVTEK